MGQYDFDYEIPDNFNVKFAHFLQQNASIEIANHILGCSIDCDDVGYAHYAGIRSGDTWNKHALDITIEGTEKDITYLKTIKPFLANQMKLFLKPSKSGFLVRNIEFIINSSGFEISLPNESEDSFEKLSSDIHEALRRNEPTLVLDRLHTYSVRYIRNICKSHGLPISDDNGKNYALHSLVGALAKYYKENDVFQSDFVNQSLKMSISVFERFNAIRNDKSYAHDNEVLNNAEATYVISIIAATLKLFQEIENI